MESKLINYGFQDWQIKELMTKKILKASHGTYTLKGNSLYLEQDAVNKKVEL